MCDGGSFRIQVSSRHCFILRSGGRADCGPQSSKGEGGAAIGRSEKASVYPGWRQAHPGAPGGRLLGTAHSDGNAKEAGGQLSTMPVKSSLDDQAASQRLWATL